MDLLSQLAQLESAEIVHRAAEDELAYLFKHALMQDTAYASLLRKTRRDIHLRVAQTIESLYADRLDENAARLAEHYAQAGDDAKTLDYSTRAGDAAARVYANAEAVAYYSRAIDAAKRVVGLPDSSVLQALYLKRGRELELASQFPAALANYSEMETLAHERTDRALELSALVAQCQIRCTANSEFDPALGEPLAEQALRLARALPDPSAEAKILWILVNLYRFTERFAQARAAGEESLRIAREMGLREQLGYTLNDLAHAYSFSGDSKRGRDLIQEATRVWRELGNAPMLADSLSTTSLYGTFTGEFDEALTLSAEAHQLSQSISNLWGQTYSLSTVGVVHWTRGDTASAIPVLEETLRLSEQSGYPVPQFITRADLGLALGSLGAFERGLAHARSAYEFANAHYAGLRGYAISALVQIYLEMDNLAQTTGAVGLFRDKAEATSPLFSFYEPLCDLRLASAQAEHAHAFEISTRLLAQLREFNLRAFVPEALCYKGMAEHGLGQIDAARASLGQAHADAQALQARWQWWQIDGALASVELDCGNRAEAKKLHEEGSVLIAYIADHAPVDLRASFLNLPRVKNWEDQYVGQ
ncbi:MAG TPA: hypothetical protein VF478_03260 [Anaerolineae bacterium]